MWFVNLLIAVVGAFAGMALYVAIVGFENREVPWMIGSSIIGTIVNRGLADIYRWLANKKAQTQG